MSDEVRNMGLPAQPYSDDQDTQLAEARAQLAAARARLEAAVREVRACAETLHRLVFPSPPREFN